MPHGEVTVWYGKDNAGTGTESGLKNGVRIEGTFRMGRPHGHARVIDLVPILTTFFERHFCPKIL